MGACWNVPVITTLPAAGHETAAPPATRAYGVHVALALAATVVLVLELQRGSETFNTSPAWPLLQAAVAAFALLFAWRRRADLRLRPVLALTVGFHLAWIAVHLALGVEEYEVRDLYPAQGSVLLDGDYPRSEYPPGAVVLFALETWLGDGSARVPHALFMVPFQFLCVLAVWKLDTRWSPWLATCVALWPMNAFYWEFRFDLLPAAALVVGLLLARRALWYEAGFVLGLGAIVKWTPALTAAALLLWLLRTRRVAFAGTHLLGFAIPVAVANVPILLWRPAELLYAYTTQNARTVTAESFVYLPISLVWDVRPGYWYFGAADVPSQANQAAIWLQLGALAAVLLLAALARTHTGAVSLAGLVPVVFLLSNRIFSPQFFLLVLVATMVATALVVRRRTEVLALAGGLAVATTANTILFQSYLGARPVQDVPNWVILSAITFLPAIAVTLWLIIRATLEREEPTAEGLDVARATARRA
jgi:hypothetical protein